MVKGKLIKDISASTIQIGITQAVNLIIFYLISKYISKEDFGFYNWSTAVCTTVIAILSLGIDLIYVKRIASDHKTDVTKNLHFFHTLFTGGLLILLVFIYQLFFPLSKNGNLLFVFVLITQICFSLANSIKLFINGSEKYNYLARIALYINAIKLALFFAIFYFNCFTIYNILLVFIASYLLEFLYSYYFSNKISSSRIKPSADLKEYKQFIRESLPQLGVILFDSAIARIDWILMGILATSIQTAEYSFTFKIFELSKIPLIIIGPILLTRFSKMFKHEGVVIPDDKKSQIQNLLNIEIFISMLIPIVMVCIWSETIDYLTNNKYGEVNRYTYMILAIAIPIHYLNNFLWTLGIAQNQLKTIMYNIIFISLLNTLMNLVLIPKYNSIGAALSYVIPSAIQFGIYYKTIRKNRIGFDLRVPLQIIFLGSGILVVVKLIGVNFWQQLLIALPVYLILCSAMKIVSVKKLKSMVGSS